MEVPQDLKYTRDHEWLRMEGDFAVIGITDFAQDSLGDVVFIDIPDEGTKLEQFAKFGEIESVKAVSDLFSPVSGDVIERNQGVIEQPELVNGDPYGQGWLVKLNLTNPPELESLLDAADYESLTAGD